MVRWYHLIMTAYGFWLPNDPRGSWSEFVASWELAKFGPATTTTERRNLARDPHDVQRRKEAKNALKYRAVRFDSRQRELVGSGFGVAVQEACYMIHACCVGRDHTHLIIARHDRDIEQIATHLKSKATMSLTRANEHPLREFRSNTGSIPTPWAKGIWKVFINDEAQLRSAISYVDRHPVKEGLTPQHWTFVTTYLFP